MRALVLCAGLGTRLRPLTERWPKPALPLLGAALLRYTLARLRAAGVDAVGINTHHLPGVMAEVAAAECARLGLGLHVVREEGEIQGTGGGIRGLRAFAEEGGGPFVVFNGDILFGLDVGAAVAAHRASGAAATMVLLPMPEGETYAAVEATADGAVRRIAGHGPGGDALVPWHFSGMHVMEPAVFEAMRPSGPEDINREVYARLMATRVGAVRGHVVRGVYWSDLGTPTRYLGTQRDVLFGQVPFASALAFEGAERIGNGWARGGARVEGKVTGPALFDAGAVVEAGAQIGSAVYVGPGAVVGAGARLNRVAVMDGTVIAPGEELVECIAYGPHRIPAPL